MAGAAAEPIDAAVLRSFLDRLHDATKDVQFLGNVVDLLTGGYGAFARAGLHRILDFLSNEMLSNEQVVGPGLRGNPRWDKTALGRLSGNLRPAHYVSRTAHRSFELPENRLLAWLVADLEKLTRVVEQYVGTAAMHSDLLALRADCETSRGHHWFGSVATPRGLTGDMLAAARRHKRPEYRTAAKLAVRRAEMETRDSDAWWHTVVSLLAVNWLKPISDDDLFELYVLLFVLDVLAVDLGLGEPTEYGLVTGRRSHVAEFALANGRLRVYFDQSPAAILGSRSRYTGVVRRHRGLSGAERRPDMTLVLETSDRTEVTIVEVKNSGDGQYLSDSVYKVFGYLYDYQQIGAAGVRAVLVVPAGVEATAGTAIESAALDVVSSDDRAALRTALAAALGLGPSGAE